MMRAYPILLDTYPVGTLQVYEGGGARIILGGYQGLLTVDLRPLAAELETLKAQVVNLERAIRLLK